MPRSIGQELLNVPMGDMIRQMALAIADAQFELDKSSILVAEMMGGSMRVRDEEGVPVTPAVTLDSRVSFGGEQLSMLELGFSPNFYQFVDTIIEVKIAVKMTESVASTYSTTTSAPSIKKHQKMRAMVTQVDASYTRKYDYSAEGASLLRTKLVPVPPPAVLEERIRALIAPTTPE